MRPDAMAMLAAADSAPLPRSAVRTVVHICPVCNTHHEICAARAELAYGRQVCCSPDCEGERRRRERGRPSRIFTALPARSTQSP